MSDKEEKKPYPTTDGITCDAQALKIISPAYASSSGELNAILQYVYHSLIFKAHGREDIAGALSRISIDEMHHFKLLGSAICALGAQPVFSAYPPAAFSFYSTKFVSYGCSLRNMLQDDLLGEKRAICAYERMCARLKNERVREIIACILQNEKEHAAILADILENFSVDK